MKKRPATQTPFMDPAQFGKSLQGFTLNVLVSDMPRAVLFATKVLGAQLRYADPDIAIAVLGSVQWLIHGDHTYDKHPLLAQAQASRPRGAGAEFRMHNGAPDQVAKNAKQHKFDVLDGPRDQPDHGLREVHISDQDGYIWVVDRPLD